MKKIYLAPTMQSIDLEMQSIIALSGVKSNYGIGFGGKDDDGDLDANVKSGNDWEVDW